MSSSVYSYYTDRTVWTELCHFIVLELSESLHASRDELILVHIRSENESGRFQYLQISLEGSKIPVKCHASVP